jgi:DedD protein
VGALALALGAPWAASAQSLHLAELFAEQGRVADARAEVLAWFEIRGDDATSEEFQHGLWLRGRLAEQPSAGMRDLTQLVDEYPQGGFTAKALAWMGAYRADVGDMEAAIELFSRVVREHPESETVDLARGWLSAQGVVIEESPAAKHADPQGAPADSVPTPPAGADPIEAMAGDSVGPLPPATDSATAMPVDTASVQPAPVDTVRVEPAQPAVDTVPRAAVDTVPQTVPGDTASLAQPDSAPSQAAQTPPADSTPAQPEAVVADTAVSPPPAVDSTPSPAPPPVERIPHGPPVPGAASGGRYAVQIGAFRNPDGASGLVVDLIEAGFEARLVQVPLNDLLRVRIGRFETQDAANAELERLRAAGHDGALIADARSETIVR